MLPSYLIILNLKDKNIFNIILFLYLLFITNGLYIVIVFIILYILYKYIFNILNDYYKDIIFLILFLIIVYFNTGSISYFIILFYNVFIYLVWYILKYIKINYY